jgi:hypothetical protein
MKYACLVGLILFAVSCSPISSDESVCPNIVLPRQTARQYQDDGRSDKFQISLTGFESYCYTDEKTNHRYAKITPIFKVRRLEASNTTRLDVSFFVKTSLNAKNYLGRRDYFQTLQIAENTREDTVKGRPTVTRIINPPYGDFFIELGLSLSSSAEQKAKSMFDIDYRYLTDKE